MNTKHAQTIEAGRVRRPLITYFGGKFRLASWVIGHMPEHRVYVEPFGGAAGVLLNKQRAYSEIYNDLDGEIVNLLRVVRDAESRKTLIEQLVLTPYAREEFELACEASTDPIERARRTCVRAQMAFGSTGATRPSLKTGFRIDAHRAYGTAHDLWARFPENLAQVGMRLVGVLIENRPAAEVIMKHDRPDTLFYIDPPYMQGTRSMRSGAGDYRCEMSDLEHADLLCSVQQLKGMAMISGYDTPLYADALSGWKKVTCASRASGQTGTVLREEVLWISPRACEALCAKVVNSAPAAIEAFPMETVE